MSRVRTLVVLLAVVLASLGVSGAPPLAGAQTATPAAMATGCPSPLATPSASPAASAMATPTSVPVCVSVIVGDFYLRPQRTTSRVGEPYRFAVGNEGPLHESPSQFSA